MVSRSRHALVLCLVASTWGGLVLGCAGGGMSTGAQAGVALGAAVAVVAVHRASTKDCWGRCSAGYACNAESGFCEPGECVPTCSEGYSCALTPTGNACEPTKYAAFGFTAGSTPVTTFGEGGAVVDPNESVFAPPRAAAGLTPGRSALGQVQISEEASSPQEDPSVQATPVPSPTQSAGTPPNAQLSQSVAPQNASGSD